MSEYKLPELPEPTLSTDMHYYDGEPAYSADQMRDYALAALRQQARPCPRMETGRLRALQRGLALARDWAKGTGVVGHTDTVIRGMAADLQQALSSRDGDYEQAGQAEPVAQWQVRYKFPLPTGGMCEWSNCRSEAEAREWLARGQYEIRALYTAPPPATDKAEPVACGGPWVVSSAGTLHTEDFAHYLVLTFNGDFETKEERAAYAQALRDKLNAPPRARVTREALRAAARIAIMGDASTEDTDMLAALHSLGLNVEVEP